MKKREQQRERKRRAILQADRETFLADGYLGAGMDRIARRAGVTKQTVYRYFKSKEALFTASLEAEREEDGGRYLKELEREDARLFRRGAREDGNAPETLLQGAFPDRRSGICGQDACQHTAFHAHARACRAASRSDAGGACPPCGANRRRMPEPACRVRARNRIAPFHM